LLAVAELSDMANRSPLLDFVVAAADVATQEVVPALMGDVVADQEDVVFMTGVALYPTVVAGGDLGRACGDDVDSGVLKVRYQKSGAAMTAQVCPWERNWRGCWK
jgi:hypothetical protein